MAKADLGRQPFHISSSQAESKSDFRPIWKTPGYCGGGRIRQAVGENGSLMRSVLETHRKAMEWAEEGQLLRDQGDHSGAREAFRKAMELEREAACAAEDTEPDRSVLFRSAGSLALDCDEIRTAEQLLANGLAGEPPEEIAEEIRDLLEQVHFRRHLGLRSRAED